MAEWVPATDAELAMLDALSAGDQAQYFQILARCELILPVPGQEAEPTDWGTWSADGRTHVLGFTSVEALGLCLAGKAGAYRRVGFEALAATWPDRQWWLAVNPGLPIEGYLPAWFVAELGAGQNRIPGRTLGATARMEHARRLHAQSVAKTQPQPVTVTQTSAPASAATAPATAAQQGSSSADRFPPVPPRSPLPRRGSSAGSAQQPPASTVPSGAAPSAVPDPAGIPTAAPAPATGMAPPALPRRSKPGVPPPVQPGAPAASAPMSSFRSSAPSLPRRTPGASNLGGTASGQVDPEAMDRPARVDPVAGRTFVPGPGTGVGPAAGVGRTAGATPVPDTAPYDTKDPGLPRKYDIGKGSNPARGYGSSTSSTVAAAPSGPFGPAVGPTGMVGAPVQPAGPAARPRVESTYSRLDAVQSRIDALQARRSSEFVQEREQISWPVPEPSSGRGHRPVVIEGSIVEVHGVEVHDGQTEPERPSPVAELARDPFPEPPFPEPPFAEPPFPELPEPAEAPPFDEEPYPEAPYVESAPDPLVEPVQDPFVAANTVEESLLQAAQAGRTDRFLSTLLLAKVLVRGCAGGELPQQGDWSLEQIEGTSHLVAYTSTERLAERSDEEPASFGWVKFTKLIEAWPGVEVSFAVNPDTPVGATLPGDEIVALASWAAKMGLTDEPESEEPPAEPQPAAQQRRVADIAKTADEPLVMQKAISPNHVSLYLDRGYDRVSGFVHRANEVDHLTSPERIYRAVGLGYAGSAFEPDDSSIYLLRWRAYRASLYRIPYGGQNEAAMRAMEGWVVERAPFRGNGFAPNDMGEVIAEFKVDSARLPHGAQLWRLDSDGTEQIIALLDADGPRWRTVGERNA